MLLSFYLIFDISVMSFAPLNVHVSVEKFHGIESQNAHDQIMSGRR